MMILKTGSGLVHQAWMPCGRRATIEAKIISEMPLPMPRWVISSPIHMTSTRAGREAEHDDDDRRRSLKFSNTGVPPAEPCERNRNV